MPESKNSFPSHFPHHWFQPFPFSLVHVFLPTLQLHPISLNGQIFSSGVLLKSIFPDEVLLLLFLAGGTFLREKRAMQDPNRHCQWRVWCQWATRLWHWWYVHADPKSPLELAICRSHREPPVKLASSNSLGCSRASPAMAVQQRVSQGQIANGNGDLPCPRIASMAGGLPSLLVLPL